MFNLVAGELMMHSGFRIKKVPFQDGNSLPMELDSGLT